MVMDAVERVMTRPWEWGRADCCTSACDVFDALHGIDPMAYLRGRYNSRAGALRLIAGYGGFLEMADVLARGSSLIRSDGGAGHIGVHMSMDPQLVIGIGNGLWAGKMEGCGFAVVTSVERCWRA